MAISKEIRTYLYKIYNNISNKASYSSPQRLYDYVKQEGKYNITLNQIQDFLDSQEVYTTHVEKNKAKNFYSMHVPYSKYLTQMDTFFFEFENEPKKRIILGIDAFSRKVAAVAVKNLSASVVKKAVQEIIRVLEPERIMFDKGREFNNSTIMNILKQKNIQHIVANPPYKSSIAERAGRTIKNHLFRAMQARGDTKWSKMLSKSVEAYNNRKHRVIKMSPNDAHKESNEASVWFALRDKAWNEMKPPTDYKFTLNQAVRIKLDEGPLVKSYFEKFSTQIYFVSARYSKSNVHRFNLKDNNNKPVDNRSFTYSQLKRVVINNETVYRIERVLHVKLIRGIPYSYVKWKGYSANFNSYIPTSELIALR